MLRLICMNSPMKIDFKRQFSVLAAAAVVVVFSSVSKIVIFSCAIMSCCFSFPWLSVHLVALTTAKFCNNSISGRLQITQPQQHSKKKQRRRRKEKTSPCFDKFVPLTLHCTWLHFSCTCKWLAHRIFCMHFFRCRCRCCCLLLISSSLTTMVFGFGVNVLLTKFGINPTHAHTCTVIDSIFSTENLFAFGPIFNFTIFVFAGIFSTAVLHTRAQVRTSYTCKFPLWFACSFCFNFIFETPKNAYGFYLCHRIFRQVCRKKNIA